MSNITDNPIWKALHEQQQLLASCHMRDLFAGDSTKNPIEDSTEDFKRCSTFSIEACGILLDFSKNLLDQKGLELLCQLAESTKLREKIVKTFQGDCVNQTENRPALHTALRQPATDSLIIDGILEGKDVIAEIESVRQKMARFAQHIRAGDWRGFTDQPIKDIVNIGVGGSHLGPEMVVEALRDFRLTHLNFHFLSNIDSSERMSIFKKIDPATTLFIISSKSLNTAETIHNMERAKAWLCQALDSEAAWQHHAVVVTANLKKAKAIGFTDEQLFPIWDWVGGRYSLWSAIGLPVMLAIGNDNFRELLAGAHEMDNHFYQRDFNCNLPVILSLLEIWYRNFWNAHTHVVIPYCQYLEKFPHWLQQLAMESNGKSVNLEGEPLSCQTAPVTWGAVGTNCQHSFMQMLHQGTDLIPVDFIAVMKASHEDESTQILLANCLAQSRALMHGKTFDFNQVNDASDADQETYKILPGNRPSNTLLIDQLTPRRLGSLLTLYEHKTVTTAAILDINPFDQWGVEIGKEMAKEILFDLQNRSDELDSNREREDSCCELDYDASTNSLIHYIKKGRP